MPTQKEISYLNSQPVQTGADPGARSAIHGPCPATGKNTFFMPAFPAHRAWPARVQHALSAVPAPNHSRWTFLLNAAGSANAPDGRLQILPPRSGALNEPIQENLSGWAKVIWSVCPPPWTAPPWRDGPCPKGVR